MNTSGDLDNKALFNMQAAPKAALLPHLHRLRQFLSQNGQLLALSC